MQDVGSKLSVLRKNMEIAEVIDSIMVGVLPMPHLGLEQLTTFAAEISKSRKLHANVVETDLTYSILVGPKGQGLTFRDLLQGDAVLVLASVNFWTDRCVRWSNLMRFSKTRGEPIRLMSLDARLRDLLEEPAIRTELRNLQVNDSTELQA